MAATCVALVRRSPLTRKSALTQNSKRRDNQRPQPLSTNRWTSLFELLSVLADRAMHGRSGATLPTVVSHDSRFSVRVCVASLVAFFLCVGCEKGTNVSVVTVSTSDGQTITREPIVLSLPMRTDGPKSMDPVRGSTTYDNRACCQVYETLVEYRYLGPLELKPLLLAEMPEVVNHGTVYRFKLKEGVRFQDDPCFPGGRGRPLTSADVFYSWKRMADNDNSPKSWWLLKGAIKGFDSYREEQNAAETFDYDAEVAGMRIINDREFEVELNQPVYRFMYVLAMFQLSIVPREAVETYQERFGLHPVGTGPFQLRDESDWERANYLILHRNPDYHACHFPLKEEVPEALHGFCKEDSFGKRLPLADRVEISFFIQDQPMWLKFRSREVLYSQVPAESYPSAFIKRTGKLRDSYVAEGIVHHAVPLLDYIFFGFNMEDKLLGGDDDKNRYLRQAISLAIDWDERNAMFYNGNNIVYDGPIPPGLDGYPVNGRAPKNYRGPNIEKANELLAKAGYPGGKGLPEIDYYVSRGANNEEQTELLTRQLAKIHLAMNLHLVDFSTLINAITKKKAPMFSFAWGSDYPDGENNLALFYGPNRSPGSNHFNYQNPEFDDLYEQIRGMAPSPERTKIYQQMRDMVIEDVPAIGSMARTRNYVVNPQLRNFLPTENFYNWVKYLDLAE